MMSTWKNMDNLDKLFIAWAFIFQIVLIGHFAVRKPFFKEIDSGVEPVSILLP